MQMVFTNSNMTVMSRLVSSGIADEIGRHHIFVSTHDAVDYCLSTMDRNKISRHPGSDLLGFPFILTVPKDGAAVNEENN